MSEKFKAIIVDQKGENFSREIRSLDKNFLKHGVVLVTVDYSTAPATNDISSLKGTSVLEGHFIYLA